MVRGRLLDDDIKAGISRKRYNDVLVERQAIQFFLSRSRHVIRKALTHERIGRDQFTGS